MLLHAITQRRHRVARALEPIFGDRMQSLDRLGLLGAYLHEVDHAIECGRRRAAVRFLARLERLLGELVAARMFFEPKPDVFDRIVVQICSTEPSNAIGARAELQMLSYLIEDWSLDPNMSLDDIVRQEAPDYRIHTVNGTIGLEVTSAWIRNPGQQDLGYKVKSKIREKSGKDYADRSTAVVIEVSNLVHAGMRQTNPTTPDDLHNAAHEALCESKLGGVVLMFFLYLEDGSYSPRYSMVTHSEASSCLADFLSAHYPNVPGTPVKAHAPKTP